MYTTKLRPLLNSKIYHISSKTVTAVAASNSVKTDEKLKSWREIPGPSSLPIIGQLHHFMPGGDLRKKLENSDGLMKLYEKFGPIVRIDGLLGRPPTVLLYDPDSVEHVLRSENWLPTRPALECLEYYRKDFKRSKGRKVGTTGLLTDHGEVWKEFRSKVNPVLMDLKTIKLYTTVLDEVAQDMVARMKANRDEKNMIRNKFDMEMKLWALESICTVALGCRLNCFGSNLPQDPLVSQLIQCNNNLVEVSLTLDSKPSFWRFFPTPMYKRAMKLFEQKEQLTRHFVKEKIAASKNKSIKENSVLEKLLEIDEEVAHIMVNDLVSVDSIIPVANTITATLYLLAKNPEKQEILREEILSKSERRPYLKACIKESLRMMPPVIGNLRVTSKEYNLLGYNIPKNMMVGFAHKDMSLMEENYPRAREYIPERWIAEKNDLLYYGNAHPFAHAPFGFGARSCIGRRIANLELEIFLSRLIQNFRVQWFGPPPKEVRKRIVYIEEPLNFVFKDV